MDDSLDSEVDESQDHHHVKFLNDSPLTSSSRTHQQFETIHAPLIRVRPFIPSQSSSSTQPVLTPTQAAGVVIHIIQFIIVNLQLTSGSVSDIYICTSALDQLKNGLCLSLPCILHLRFILWCPFLLFSSWTEILSTRQQIEKDAERSSKPMPIKRKKFMKVIHYQYCSECVGSGGSISTHLFFSLR